MLKYSIKPSKSSELAAFPIRELYVSPDLLFISGVTDYNVGLVDGEEVLIKSPYLIGDELNTINITNVKRQGRVKVSIKLPVNRITTTLNFPVFSENGRYYIYAHNHKVELSEDEYDGGDFIFSR